MKRKLIK